MILPTMPEKEALFLRQCYEDATVILEYGSGGSTKMAAQMPGKFIVSVESDRDWALALQAEIAQGSFPSTAIVHHASIGPTWAWGRAKDASCWQKFHRYPMDVWDQPFFRHPDVVLVDGRFRAACLVTVALRAERQVRVLFDDYGDRPEYHVVEKFLRPTRHIGRMAVFMVEPGQMEVSDWTAFMGLFVDVRFANTGSTS
jgi:hypothetical protein